MVDLSSGFFQRAFASPSKRKEKRLTETILSIKTKYITMAEAFNTNIILTGKEAADFRKTMIDTTPQDQIITKSEYAKLKEIAKELGFGNVL